MSQVTVTIMDGEHTEGLPGSEDEQASRSIAIQLVAEPSFDVGPAGEVDREALTAAQCAGVDALQFLINRGGGPTRGFASDDEGNYVEFSSDEEPEPEPERPEAIKWGQEATYDPRIVAAIQHFGHATHEVEAGIGVPMPAHELDSAISEAIHLTVGELLTGTETPHALEAGFRTMARYGYLLGVIVERQNPVFHRDPEGES